jgi:hypothetical protein
MYHFHYSPSFLLNPEIVSIGLIFPFTYMCTQYLHYIHPHTLSPYFLPTPTGTNPSDRTCSALLFSNFVKEKNDIFVYLR